MDKNKSNLKKINRINFILFLLFNPILGYTQSVSLTVDASTPISTSRFATGMCIMDKSLNAQTKILVKNGLSYASTYIMAWGTDDPWPDSTKKEPSNWSSLDDNMNTIIQTGVTPVIDLCEAPWWIKGIAKSDEWGTVAYETRVADNMMNQWLHLVKRVAERYMAAPYNVRHFQVWNEMKGYWNNSLNHWDYNNSPGDTTGANHKHGLTYMYNKVYTVLKQVAQSKGISPSDIKVGGPYVSMGSGASASSMSHPSSIKGPWGVLDQRELDVISYWLNNKIGAELIVVDGWNRNSGAEPADAFGMCDKFSAINNWIRQQSNGGATLPIFWAEIYIGYNSLPNTDAVNNALGAYAVSQLILSGASIPFLWGGRQSNGALPAMWNDAGTALPWYNTFKNIEAYFGLGKTLCKTSSSSINVAILATNTQAMLVNKTNSAQPFQINGVTQTSLMPYEVRFINLSTTTNIKKENEPQLLIINFNAATNFITIENSSIIKEFTLFNLTGAKIYSEKNIAQNKIELNTSSFSSGLYFLSLRSESGTLTKKIIIYK